MDDLGLSSSDMLLTNLADHQVVRIDGSERWMQHQVQQIKQSHADALELSGALSVAYVQTELADFLQVEAGASFVQQELKQWLSQQRHLHVIVNSDDVDVDCLTYLLGLPSICDESGSAVTIILLTTPKLVALLSSSSLTRKLDGYYQEESEEGGVVSSGSKSITISGAVVLLICIGGAWYWSKPDTNEVQVDNSTATSVINAEQQQPPQTTETVVAEAKVEAEKVASQDPAQLAPQIVNKSKTVEAAIAAAPELAPAEVHEVKKELNSELLASLTATVEKAKRKRDGIQDQALAKEPESEVIAKSQPSEQMKVEVKEEVLPQPQPIERAKELVVKTAPLKDVVEAKEVKAKELKATAPVVPTATVAKVQLAQAQPTNKAELVEPKGLATKPVVVATKMPVSKSVSDIANLTAKQPISEAEETVEFESKAFPGTQTNSEASVRKAFSIWSQAWADQDWDNYINSYLQNTTLYGVKMSVEEWREFRKTRLLSPAWIKLEFGKPKYTRLNSHWYRVEFYQRFEKPGYADETTKRLELTLTGTGWKIASEAAKGTVVLSRGK